MLSERSPLGSKVLVGNALSSEKGNSTLLGISRCPLVIYYNKPSQKGLIAHYQAVANASPVPIILYNVPGRTGVNMLPETTLALARHKNIIAIKEASGNLEQMMKIIHHKPEKFMVISGDDALTLPLIVLGGVGVISVVAQAFPREYSELVNLALNGKYDKAKKIHYSLLEITESLFKEGNPAGIKELLQYLKICENNLRLPLVNISKDLSEKIQILSKKLVK